MRSIEYTVQNLEEILAGLDSEIAGTQKRLTELTLQSAQPFEYAGRLGDLLKRQQELADALDLTRNQASSGLASDVAQDASVASEAGAMMLGEIGFPEYEY